MIRNRLYRITAAAVLAMASLCATASIPAGYYSSLDGKSGQALKDAIHELVQQHTTFSYGSLWIYFAATDCRPEDKSKVWDMYSDITYYFRGQHLLLQGRHKRRVRHAQGALLAQELVGRI